MVINQSIALVDARTMTPDQVFKEFQRGCLVKLIQDIKRNYQRLYNTQQEYNTKFAQSLKVFRHQVSVLRAAKSCQFKMHRYQQMVKHRANCELKLDLLYQKYLAENKLRDVTRHFQQNKSVDYEQISRIVNTSREYTIKVKQYRLVRLMRLKQRAGLACKLLERQAVIPMQLKQLKAEKQMLMRLEKVQMKN